MAGLIGCMDDTGDGARDSVAAVDVGQDGSGDAGAGVEGGLRATVEVWRDASGMAHIRAQSRHDAFFMQGYETARDRLWNLDFLRHFVYGTQASVYGEAFVEDDILKRGLNLRRVAEQTAGYYERELPDVYAHLQAYADGVNAWMYDVESGRNGATLPSEFDRIPGAYELAPWTVVDSIAVGKALVLSQSFQPDLELAFFAGNLLMGDTFREMFPFTPLFATHALEEAPTPDSELSLEYRPGLDSEKERQTLTPEVVHALNVLIERLIIATGRDDISGKGGSNAWAVAGTTTASGHAMLCNDTHMTLDLPSNLYPIHVTVDSDTAEAMDFFGYNGPGMPMAIIGNNRDVSWALTNAYADVTDLYQETLSADGTTVLFRGQQVPLEIRDEVIPVRAEDGTVDASRTVRIRSVPHHGPLLNDLLPPEIGNTLNQFNFIFSVRWTGFEPESSDFRAFLNLIESRNVDDGIAALRDFSSGVMSFTFADSAGDIAYMAAGPYPQRPWDFGANPPYSVLDGTGELEWGDRIPFDEIPRLVRPAKGYAVNANASVGPNALDNNPETGDFYFSHFLDLGTRAWRLTDVLHGLTRQGDITLDRLRALQADNFSIHASVFLPTLLDQRQAICDAQPESDECVAVQLLADWDLMQDADSAAAAIFNAWCLQFMWDTYVDDTNELVQQLLGPELDNSAGRGIGHWLRGRTPPSGRNYFDVAGTERVESAADVARGALTTSMQVLREFYGPERDPVEWRWDEAHQVTWRHQVWRDLDEGPRGMGSGFRTVNAADYRLVIDGELARPPYQMNEGPGIRYCVEMTSDFPTVTGSVNGGISGHAESPYFTDQLDDWVAGVNRPVPMDRQAVEALGEPQVFAAGFGALHDLP
jgi:penicillin amidase